MNRRVKVIAAVLAAILFAGCGDTTSTTKEPVAVNNSAVEDVSGATDTASGATGENQSASEAASGTETVEEAVLFEENGIRITMKSLDTKDTFGPSLKLLLENDSDRDITIQTRNESVNGYMIGTMFSADVAAGKKANDSLAFMRSSLERCGVSTIADMEFSFHIFESSSWETILDSPMVQVKTSAADGYTYSFDDSGTPIYDENGLRLIIKGLAEDSSIFGPEVMVYVENNSGQDVTIQARDVSLNGFMVTPMFSVDVLAGKHAVDGITFMSSELEENDISEIHEVECSFHVFDMHSWDTIKDTDPINIQF